LQVLAILYKTDEEGGEGEGDAEAAPEQAEEPVLEVCVYTL
jgi:hypothetical protein